MSAFKATGIYPLDASKVLNQIKRKTPSPVLEPTKATPTSLQGIRRAIQRINKEQQLISAGTQQLFHASEKLATENSILRHENKCLREAFIDEKRRRKRGKAMGLIDKEKPGEAQFFSPSKVEAARKRMTDLEIAKEQEKAQAADLKLQKAIQREEKARKVAEQKAAQIAARQEARGQIAKEKAERAAQRAAHQAAQQQKKAQQAAERAAKQAAKAAASSTAKRVHQADAVDDAERPPKRQQNRPPNSAPEGSILQQDSSAPPKLDISAAPKLLPSRAAAQHQDPHRRMYTLPLRSGRLPRPPKEFESLKS